MTVPQQSVTSSLVFPIDDVLEFISNFSGSFARALIAYLLTPVFAHRRLSQAYPEFCWILRCPQPSCFSRRRCFRKICRTFLEISWNFLQCLNRLSSLLGFYPSTAFSNTHFFQEFSHLPQSSVAFPPFFPGGNLKVCTRNDDLEDVISRTPISRREDLVFLQNSVLAPLLEKHGLAKNTQARSLDLGRYSIEIENFSCETFILFFWKLIFASCVCYFLSTPRS